MYVSDIYVSAFLGVRHLTNFGRNVSTPSRDDNDNEISLQVLDGYGLSEQAVLVYRLVECSPIQLC